jgi:threonine synthase
VHNVAVKNASFDDCQSMVKDLFNDEVRKSCCSEEHPTPLTSVNLACSFTHSSSLLRSAATAITAVLGGPVER